MDVKTPKGIFTRILVPTYARHGEYGTPEIPVFSQLIEIPSGADAVIHILYSSVREYKLKDLGIEYALMPHQPPVPKTGEPVEFVYNKDSYKINAFGSQEIAVVEYLGAMRNTEIGRLDIMPVQYNPVAGTIRVYENLEIEVVFENADFEKTARQKMIYRDPYFSGLIKNTLAYSLKPEAGSRENLTQYPIKYVIVSDRMFEEQLQPLVEWKRKKGFTVIEAYTDDPLVGTTTYQIKAFLEGLYDNATPEDPAPSFVLFVGDIAQVPTWTGIAAGHVTDLFYCEYTGDYFPEIFYARFSAQNTAQLQPQIDKTLMYEQYTMPVSTYLDTVVMIAGMDGTFGPTHGNGQINYGTENYFNASNGLYSHTYLYPQSGSSSAQIRQNISDGVTLANYTAHGSPSGWADPSFVTSDIPAMQNEGKYGLLVGNCCSTSEYQVNECFGEALLRAVNKGAVGYVGASNSTYWDEDYYFGVGVGTIAGDPPAYEETTLGYYDRMFHSHGESFGEWYTTMAQVIFAGNLAVTQGSPGSAQYYWEAYCLMGDPSLMIYFAEPPAMTVTYEPLIPMGSTSFTVNAVPYSYVAISMDTLTLGTALADASGVAVVSLIPSPAPGNADVVVTAQNFQPFTGTVMIDNPSGPFVMLNQLVLDDSQGNYNGMAEFGEIIMLDVELKNWGGADAVNTLATLSTLNEYVTITDTLQEYGTILTQDSVLQSAAFEFQIADSIPDMHSVMFNLKIEDETRQQWNADLIIIILAPEMELGALTVVDTAGGNGNYRLDPGETVDLLLDCHNPGHCDAMNSIATLQSQSPYITLLNTSSQLDTIPFGSMKQAVFQATISEEVEAGMLIDLAFHLNSGVYSSSLVYSAPVGLILEDFESGGFEAFDWIMAGSEPWTITSEEVYAGEFSARSGIIDHDQTSELLIDVNVATDDSVSFYRKVSCEDDPAGTGYDWLAFYIDDSEKDRWDGEVSWSKVTYPVTAGQHTFKWVYSKDYSVAGGSDAAWIDNITFPAIVPAVSVDEPGKENAAAFSVIPNPARNHTEFYIHLNQTEYVTVSVYDLAGNKVTMPVNGEKLAKGMHRLLFDASLLAPGVYFCVMNAGEEKISQKLIIQK
jgi:hypothetical protein